MIIPPIANNEKKGTMTMKAEYQAPAVECLFAEGDSLLQETSLPEELSDGQDLDKAPTTEQTSGNLSRFNIWDDED